jgi:general secretion pathway protein F
MTYLVKVIRRDDSIGSVLIDAEDPALASQRARAEGYVVLGAARQRAWQVVRRQRAPKFSTLMFSQELVALLAAGLSLIEALAALKSKRRYQGAAVVDGIARSLSEGHSLSAAVAQYPAHFSPLYVASIQASERTGNLPEALERLVAYQEQMDTIRKKLVAASTYPAVLTLVGALVMLFLLLYVVPRFSKVYETFSGELPFFSRILIDVGAFVSGHTVSIVLALALLAAGGIPLLRSAGARRRLSAWAQRIPVLAENARLYEFSRLYRTLGMLLRGGVPMSRAMLMAQPLLGLAAQDRMRTAHRLISEGRSISAALGETGLTTPVAQRMLVVGEQTGGMGDMMERIAAYHEADLARWIEDFSRLFEPALMLILGLMVGAIVVVMYMPIFELATAIQ